MTYERVNWKAGKSGGTPLSEENLNHMDSGIEQAHKLIGEIMEEGSNENGSWIKFSNGIMICTKIVSITTQINKAWGAMFESPDIQWGAMAQTFTQLYAILTTNIGRTATVEGLQATSLSSFGRSWLLRPVPDSDPAQYTVHFVAIGKWK